jgi:hypothetical protein
MHQVGNHIPLHLNKRLDVLKSLVNILTTMVCEVPFDYSVIVNAKWDGRVEMVLKLMYLNQRFDTMTHTDAIVLGMRYYGTVILTDRVCWVINI